MNLGCFPYRFWEGNYFLVAQTCIICGLMYELECKYFSEYKELREKNKSLLFITTNRTDILPVRVISSKRQDSLGHALVASVGVIVSYNKLR